MKASLFAALFGAIGLATLAGCPGVSESADCTDSKTCSGGDASASNGDADAGVGSETGAQDGALESGPAPGCEKTPSESSDVIADRCGVFVSPTGSDTALGTKADPWKTLTKAITSTRGGNQRIHVCAGANPTYVEALVLTSLDTGREIFGGLSCDTWAYDATKIPNVKASAAGTSALVVDGTTGVRIEDLGFESVDASPAGAGASSVAVFVKSGAEVTLRRVKMKAGVGADAPPSGAAGNLTMPGGSRDGSGATGTVGGPAKDGPTCPSGVDTSRGGGGKGGVAGSNAENGAPAIAPPSPATATGAGGVVGASCTGTTLGTPGSNGKDGNTGANASVLGVASTSGWAPAPGTDGTDGTVAQGGGGGGGPTTGAGGGGGVGGCGGGAGKGGGGGGGSIGVLVFDAKLTLASCAIVTSNGGKAGAGGAGQGGQGGGSGGGGASGGCAGGNGGTGGAGGHGGGGAGGVSIGVLYKSVDVPTTTSLTVTRGTGGSGGAGGTGPVLAGASEDVKGL